MGSQAFSWEERTFPEFLTGGAAQLDGLVLSHSRTVLCSLWGKKYWKIEKNLNAIKEKTALTFAFAFFSSLFFPLNNIRHKLCLYILLYPAYIPMNFCRNSSGSHLAFPLGCHTAMLKAMFYMFLGCEESHFRRFAETWERKWPEIL